MRFREKTIGMRNYDESCYGINKYSTAKSSMAETVLLFLSKDTEIRICVGTMIGRGCFLLQILRLLFLKRNDNQNTDVTV